MNAKIIWDVLCTSNRNSNENTKHNLFSKFSSKTILLASILATTHAKALVYCVDPSPSPLRDEISCETYLATLSDVNNLNLAPGDKVLFRRGAVWEGMVTVNQSGEPDNPIVFGSYGSEGANPLIKRTAKPSWWQHSEVANGGFEMFTGDASKPDFRFPWRTYDGVNAYITADSANALIGKFAAKLERVSGATSDKPRLIMSKTLAQGAPYYVKFSTKTIAAQGSEQTILAVTVLDANGNKYWDPTTKSWTQSVTRIGKYASTSVQSYSDYNFTFATLPDAGQISIRFEILDGFGAAWLDEVVVMQGETEPSQKIWTASFAGAGKIYGAMQGNQRIVPRQDTKNPYDLLEGEFLAPINDQFYYRKDTQYPPIDLEVARNMNAIRIERQHDVVVEGIDAIGPGTRFPEFTRDREAGGLIFITPGSHDVTIRNLVTSMSNATGVSAGVFRDDQGAYAGLLNPYNITYVNINSYNNGSTGIYLRGSGSISKCVSHDNGTLINDFGDRGGIGLQEGPSTIEDNEIFNLGSGNTDIDFAISACCYINGPFVIRRNYIHDVTNGGIQLDNSDQESLNLGHLVEYNIFDRYGQNEYSGDVSYGKFAAIRIRNFQGTTIRNNVIANGGPHLQSKGILLRDDVSNTSIHNNIFYFNTQADIRVVPGAVYSGVTINNNIYNKQSFSGNWILESQQYNSLADWVRGTGFDMNSGSDDPSFVNPVLGDFHLKAGSLAMDSGLNTGQVKDYDGLPIQRAPDIGAHEIQDADSDGYVSPIDCNDLDATIYPGAVEIKNDGIDQDCNGYDLTINVTKATIQGASLKVTATSAYGINASLKILGIGDMSWSKGEWTYSGPVGKGLPNVVTVFGIEGSVTEPVQLK